MPRSPRADEAGGLYHALNRANFRATIFKKDEDYIAFDKILHEALEIHDVQLYSYQVDARAIARSFAFKASVDRIENGVVPSSAESFASNVLFDGSVALQNVQRHASKCGSDFWRGVFANSACVL